MGRQIITATDGITAGVDIVPGLHLTECHILETLGKSVTQGLGLHRLGLHGIETLGIGGTLTIVGHQRCCLGEREATHIFLGHPQTLDAQTPAVHPEEVHTVAVFGLEIEVAVGLAPFHRQHIGIEVTREGCQLLAAEVHQIELGVNHAGGLSLLHLLADAVERLGRTHDDHLFPVG